MLKNNSEHFLSPVAASEVQHMPPTDDPYKKIRSSIFGWNSTEALLSTKCDGVSKPPCKKGAAQPHEMLAAMRLNVFSHGCTRNMMVKCLPPTACQRPGSRHQECFRSS